MNIQKLETNSEDPARSDLYSVGAVWCEYTSTSSDLSVWKFRTIIVGLPSMFKYCSRSIWLKLCLKSTYTKVHTLARAIFTFSEFCAKSCTLA